MPSPTLFVRLTSPEVTHRILQALDDSPLTLLDQSSDEQWLNNLVNKPPTLCLLDVTGLSDAQMDRLIQAKLAPDVETLLISDGAPNPAITALMAQGAAFHFRPPLNEALIVETLKEIAAHFHTRRYQANTVLRSELDEFGLLVGSSPRMHKLYRTLYRGAKSDANVLITGESGSGKELAANSIHLASRRSDKPFIAVNCGAISPELIDSELFGHEKGAFTGASEKREGLFAQARGGTLFLDEITEMPLDHQTRLLRVLEAGNYRRVGGQIDLTADVRVVAAANRNAHEAIADGHLREDLYYRLAQFPITLPPLRERGDDIVGLAKHFIAHRNAQEAIIKSVTDAALEKIARYSWPGNVRELKHAIERAYILADQVIDVEHLILDELSASTNTDGAVPAKMPLDAIERIAIEKTLKENSGNKTDTAQDLGISVKTLYNKLEKYHVLR